jgi:large subunit ribosomal protein L17
MALLHDKQVGASLFEQIGPRYANRHGGYCRILHLSKTRVGDGAAQALFELVESEVANAAPAVEVTPPANS